MVGVMPASRIQATIFPFKFGSSCSSLVICERGGERKGREGEGEGGDGRGGEGREGH